MTEETEETLMDRVARQVVDAALKVHKKLGPGLLESIYEVCLCHELKLRGMKVLRQLKLPIEYEGVVLETGLVIDLLVEDLVVVELKAVEKILPVHEAQLLSYLRLAKKPLSLLINFNVPLIKDGIKRMRL